MAIISGTGPTIVASLILFGGLLTTSRTHQAPRSANRFSIESPTAQTDCPSMNESSELPDVGRVDGRKPIWLADGRPGMWYLNQPVKSLWVLARTATGRLRVEGHRLDGSGRLEFKESNDSTPQPMLAVADPWHGSIMGSRPDVSRDYAFVPSYVLYPSPGCWQLTARLGDHEVVFIRRLSARSVN